MLISAVQKFTVLDYPDHTACIVFTPGCNFRCGYCHNPEFVLPELIQKIKSDFIDEEVFFHFLEKRKNLLQGVVITGGEPTLMPDLYGFIKKVRDMGFLVKLDSNGARPEVLQVLLADNLIDYIAMDVKTSMREYTRLVGPRIVPENIERSIHLIQESGVPYEFRTTLIRELHPPEILAAMSEMLRGAKTLFLQSFRPQKTLDPTFGIYHPFSEADLEKVKEIFAQKIENVYVR